MDVAPLVGAWIEIYDDRITNRIKEVAPLVGAWIEITKSDVISVIGTSLLL